MQGRTTLFIIGTIVMWAALWIGYDVYAIGEGGTEASISYMIFEWSYKYPIFTFCAGLIPGVLVGHFFWRIRDTEGTKIISDNSRE